LHLVAVGISIGRPDLRRCYGTSLPLHRHHDWTLWDGTTKCMATRPGGMSACLDLQVPVRRLW
jgi:hypothetical protein